MLADDKITVAQKYKGAHEFKPPYRGECYTNKFNGTHPLVIKRNMASFQEKSNLQLETYICPNI